jgi:hypothetical protein
VVTLLGQSPADAEAIVAGPTDFPIAAIRNVEMTISA